MRPTVLAMILLALFAAGGSAFFANRLISSSPAPVQARVEEVPAVQVLVAAADIKAGQPVGATVLRWSPWPQDLVRPGQISVRAEGGTAPAAAQQAAMQGMDGKLARRAIAAGEPITEASLFLRDNAGFLAGMLEEGTRAVSIPVSAATAASGFILPGDRVDIILSHDLTRSLPDTGELGARIGIARHAAETVVQDVRVLTVDQTMNQGGEDSSQVGKTVTLEVSAAQAEVLAVALQMGEVSLALRGLGDTQAMEEGAAGDMSAAQILPQQFVSDVIVSPSLATAVFGTPQAPHAAPPNWKVSIHRGGRGSETIAGR